jgi:outer membrane receptor for ferrienterochelin and colicins
LNYLKKYNLTNGIINLESSGHLFYKPNFANYDLNPNQIVYDNLNGYSKILDSVLILIGSRHLIKSNCRCHFDPISKTAKICTAITEKYLPNWAISYEILGFADYTGNLTGPMRLPLLGELDPDVKFLCLLAFKTSNLHLRKSII